MSIQTNACHRYYVHLFVWSFRTIIIHITVYCIALLCNRRISFFLNQINGLLITTVKSNVEIIILLLYRNNNTPVQNFFLALREILSSYTVHIILGDFNINFLNPRQSSGLTQLMESFNFRQTVSEPTFLPEGSLQVYINLSYISPSRTCTLVKSVYYSDHDAVKLSFPLYSNEN